MSSLLHSFGSSEDSPQKHSSKSLLTSIINSRSKVSVFFVGLTVWIGCALYLVPFVERGWIPHDEGLLGHTAERVLSGELPHKDFDDTYTGGLAFLHSIAFRILGVHLSSLRWTFFAASMLFVPLLYLLALRSGPPLLAGLVTLVCFTWSVPNYFASMPSWYVLFLAVGAMHFFTRFVESNTRNQLVAAGICCGVAMLAKITGLFIVAAGLLFLMYHDQVRSQTLGPERRSRCVYWASTILVTSYCGLLALMLSSRADASIWVNLFVPNLTVAAFISWNEYANGRGTLSDRTASLAKDVTVFVAGIAIPVAVFAIPYAAAGSLKELAYGVFILPFQRVDNAAVSFPPFLGFLATIPMAILLFRGWTISRLDDRTTLKVTLCVFSFIVVALALSGSWGVHRVIWLSVRLLPPLTVAAVSIYLVKHSDTLPAAKRELVVLPMLGIAVLSVTQFPYAEDIYFCYVVPLLILTIVQFRSVVAGSVPVREAGILVFFLLFAVGSLNHCYLAREPFPDDDAVPLSLTRASMTTRAAVAAQYRDVVNIVQKQSAPGDTIYAAPDCPEVYFLTNRRNPTRTMYDFFDPVKRRTESLIAMLDDEDIHVVVVNMFPDFSDKMDEQLRREVIAKFPQLHVAGRFIVAVRASPTEEPSDIPERSPAFGVVTESASRSVSPKIVSVADNFPDSQ